LPGGERRRRSVRSDMQDEAPRSKAKACGVSSQHFLQARVEERIARRASCA
jgi:hypothetical protein